jgi:hypothetical protein
MIYQLFIEGREADINEQISVQLTLAIDDINKYGSRDTSFSKTIVLPGTNANNAIFGNIAELGSSNPYTQGAANVGVNFNVAQISRAELRLNGLLICKGVFRLTGIVRNKSLVEYEGSIFGELGGFIANIGNKKLEDLDFSEYDHEYNTTNIKDSWDAINGSGYYYPLIDYGTYSTGKVDYDIKTFRPAFYVKEYLDKIFHNAGYTYESSFLDSALFQKLVIPANVAKLRRYENNFLSSYLASPVSGDARDPDPFNIESLDLVLAENYKVDFTGTNSYQYTGDPATLEVKIKISGRFISQENTSGLEQPRLWITSNFQDDELINVELKPTKISGGFPNPNVWDTTEQSFTIENTWNVEAATLDLFSVNATAYFVFAEITELTITVKSLLPILTDIQEGEHLNVNDIIPRNIQQKDFFGWILRMFNLYVTDDKFTDKKLLIEPYKDYYDLTTWIDWTYKIAQDKAWQIKPMGMLNGRFFEYKFKEDNDFYNEGYKKKYNQSYGDRLEDTGFQFAKDKQTIEIGFSPTVLVKYELADKVVPAIYKKSGDTEDRMDSNIRILLAKKITGVTAWDILDGSNPTPLENDLTVYGYAGHFDDPADPTVDINFGAASEIYFSPNSYTSNNLFNVYWSGYIGEIADKDSKLLTCYVYLNELDLANLDFAKPVFIDGVLWRINKVIDYDATNNELTKVELLKVINNG